MTTNSPVPALTRFFSRILPGLLFSLVSLGLLVWALVNYRLEPTQPIFYGSRAIYSTLLLALVLALLGRVLLLRILKREIGTKADIEPEHDNAWRLLLLLDIVAPVYLT